MSNKNLFYNLPEDLQEEITSRAKYSENVNKLKETLSNKLFYNVKCFKNSLGEINLKRLTKDDLADCILNRYFYLSKSLVSDHRRYPTKYGSRSSISLLDNFISLLLNIQDLNTDLDTGLDNGVDVNSIKQLWPQRDSWIVGINGIEASISFFNIKQLHRFINTLLKEPVSFSDFKKSYLRWLNGPSFPEYEHLRKEDFSYNSKINNELQKELKKTKGNTKSIPGIPDIIPMEFLSFWQVILYNNGKNIKKEQFKNSLLTLNKKQLTYLFSGIDEIYNIDNNN